MKNRSVIELTSQFFTDVSIETKSYRKTKKGLNEKSKWSNLLFVSHRCFNEGNDQSREKQAIVLKIEGRSSLPLSDDRRIEFNGDNNQPREKQELEWKFIKWPNSVSRDRMSLVFHVMWREMVMSIY